MYFIKYLYFYIQVFQKQTEELIKSILGTKSINSTINIFFFQWTCGGYECGGGCTVLLTIRKIWQI